MMDRNLKGDERTKIVKEFYRCIDTGEMGALKHIMDNAFFDHDAQNKDKGLDELEGLITALHDGFNDILHELEQIHLLGEDQVFVRWKMTGKHIGNFFGVLASGKSIQIYGHDLFTIKHGKILEQWHIEQLLSLMNQIASNNVNH